MVRRGLLSLLGAVAAGLCLGTPSAPAQVPVEGACSVVADGGSCLIAKSRSGKTHYGDSIETEKCEGAAVTNPEGSRLEPILGPGVGYVAVGKRVRALSGLPEARGARNGPGRIRIDGARIQLFSAVTGEGSSVALGVDMDSPCPDGLEQEGPRLPERRGYPQIGLFISESGDFATRAAR
jgi:hypothetical protein